jgi:hypothetical protein
MIKARKTLSYKEEKDVDEKIDYLSDVLEGVETQQGVKHEIKDTKMVEDKLKQLKRVKEQFGVTRLEGSERAAAEKEIQRLEDRMGQFWGGRFPTYSEHWMKPKDGGIRYLRYVEAIRKSNSSREYAGLIARWKTLKRSMDPSDPNASNTLQLYRQ